ncbi:peroxiredoxin [Planifilum fimeticola]|uniref:Peroxiredoxin n=2 Tax=Planifilum fimeticola TaxID=201975 RepID=A0A2T0LH50_9BACL|nr:peroxiredoxin [Planifilum fimeticola]
MLAMLALIGFALYQTGESEAVEIGQTAPDFELTTLDGKTVRLSEVRGKGVLINFWASWCKPCRDEMPAIQRVYERHRDKGLEVLGVNIAETGVTVDGFVRHLDLTFPILLDQNREVTQLYGIGPIPSSIFVSPEGKVVRKVSGQMQEGQIESMVLEILPK